MPDMPDKIWAHREKVEDEFGGWCSDEACSTEYVRADMIEKLVENRLTQLQQEQS